MTYREITLLQQQPQPRLDRQLAKQTLTFAFATGTGSDPFERLFAKLRRPQTSFVSDCFASDLFLDAFVERCLPHRTPGTDRRFHAAALRKALAAPPTTLSDIRLRQEIFVELQARPELYEACQRAWRLIDSLRVAFESSEMTKRFEPIHRRLEILRQVAALLERLGTDFADAKSALVRLSEFGKNALAEPNYQVIAQLLDHEAHLATLQLEVKLDREGQIRTLEITSRRENSANPFYRGPWSRFFQRLGALFRGYQLHEREVIGRLVESVFDELCPAIITLFELSLDLEFYLALDGFRRFAEDHQLEVCMPRLTPLGEGTPLRLTQVYNPFLLLEERRPVPCDLALDQSGLVLITGPNSGGKTRLLQSIGFVQLLAQSGSWVPAREASVPLRTGLFVSLVHESHADQKEGRLGTELLRIRRLFERLEYDQLVLLDELCSGTNPSEGEQIVELVISLLTTLRPQALITTHFLQFAERLAQHPPVDSLRFLQVSLDPHEQPLYQFVPGVASTSLANRTAERLGVTREALETLIRQKPDER